MMTLVIFLLILSVLVLVHELGHFLVAKKAGILVEEFGLGLPPRLWGKKRGETVYSLNWLPIGGFVKLYGEDQPEAVNPERAFFMQSKRVRLAVLLAGVAMNFVLGVAVFAIIYTKLGIPTPTETVRVVEVVPGTPADKAGIKPGEVVVAVGAEPVKSTDRFIELVGQSGGEKLQITLGDGEAGKYGRLVEVVPQAGAAGSGRDWEIGVVISNVEMKQFPVWQMPFRGAVVGVKEAWAWGVMIASGVGQMAGQLVVKGEAPHDVAGPVGIFQLTGTVKQAGIMALLQFMGVLSINLAVVNLLPLPALDGGRLGFLLVEAVTGKRVKPKWEKWIHAAGMVMLLTLMGWVTINDIVRLINR